MKKLTLVVSFLTVAALIVLASGCTRSMGTGPIPTPGAAQSVSATPTPGAIPTAVIATTVAGATATRAAVTVASATPVTSLATATATKQPAVVEPTATKAAVAAAAATAVPTAVTSASGTATTYTVQQGEWLFSIARKFGVSPYTLAQVNNITPPYTIYPGRVLTIPGSPVPGPTATPGPAPTTYTVQSGDTVYSIGRKFGRTPAAIINANNLVNPNFLFPGQVLRIP